MNENLKSALFFFLEHSKINSLFRKINKGRIKVLMFHSISSPGIFFNNSVSPEDFTKQLKYLLKHYSILIPTQEGEILGYSPDKVNILLTFDDGFIDNYSIATPLLCQYGVSAIFFVIANCLKIGEAPEFIKKRIIKDYDLHAYRTIKVTQAQEMVRMTMVIGSHSISHADFSKLSGESCIKDGVESKKIIEKEVGCRVNFFAFPWGKYNEQQLKSLNEIYEMIFTTNRGFNSIGDRVFCRNEVANYFHLCCTSSGALDYFSNFVKFHNK